MSGELGGSPVTAAPALTAAVSGSESQDSMRRDLNWTGAFWASSGVPAGVMLTLGGVAALIGKPSWVVWIASILMGFAQSFVYAEIAGLYPSKSGGASIYGAAAWIPYSKWVAPISVWCNWLAWSPTMALGVGLAAAYTLTGLFPATAALHHWEVHLVDLGFVHQGLSLRINAISIVAAAFLLVTFFLQHHGVNRAANVQKILAIASLSPLLIIGFVPLFTGDLPSANLFPLLPLVRDLNGQAHTGEWNATTITVLMGSMFGAGWATYGFETAVCYTREFKNPATDTYRAIIASGTLCIITFTLVPLAFLGSLGLDALLDPSIYDGTGVAFALARIVKGGVLVTNVLVVMMILALLLIVNSSMMGSSRTLYQASADGWLPRYLSKLNKHGAPTSAMWTDLGFNLILLMMSDYFFVLVVSNVCYLLFNFLNLQAGWIHRRDRPDWPRPFRCPTWLLLLGAVLGFVNMVFVGAGADVWGNGTLRNGLIAVAVIIPVFAFRHYVQDKGQFPVAYRVGLAAPGPVSVRRAGIWPFVALAACAGVLWASHHVAVLPK